METKSASTAAGSSPTLSEQQPLPSPESRPAIPPSPIHPPQGTNVSYTMKYGSYNVLTNFGCAGITEYSATAVSLVSEIDLPDQGVNANDKYTFTYEPTPSHAGYVTGRLASVSLPTGGTNYICLHRLRTTGSVRSTEVRRRLNRTTQLASGNTLRSEFRHSMDYHD